MDDQVTGAYVQGEAERTRLVQPEDEKAWGKPFYCPKLEADTSERCTVEGRETMEPSWNKGSSASIKRKELSEQLADRSSSKGYNIWV